MSYPGYFKLANPLTQDQLYKFLIYMGDPDFVGEREFAYILGTFPACIGPKIKTAKGRKKTDKGYTIPVESLDKYLGYTPRRPDPLTDKETELFKGFVERFCVINRYVVCNGTEIFNEYNDFVGSKNLDLIDRNLDFYSKLIKYLHITYPNKAFRIVNGTIYGIAFTKEKGSVRYCELVSKLIELGKKNSNLISKDDCTSIRIKYKDEFVRKECKVEICEIDDYDDDDIEDIIGTINDSKEEEKGTWKNIRFRKEYITQDTDLNPGPLFNFLYHHLYFIPEDLAYIYYNPDGTAVIEMRFKDENYKTIKRILIRRYTNRSSKCKSYDIIRSKGLTESQFNKADAITNLFKLCCELNKGTKHQSILSKFSKIADYGINIAVTDSIRDKMIFLSDDLDIDDNEKIGCFIDISLSNTQIEKQLRNMYLSASSKIKLDDGYIGRKDIVKGYCSKYIDDDDYIDVVSDQISRFAKDLIRIYDR